MESIWECDTTSAMFTPALSMSKLRGVGGGVVEKGRVVPVAHNDFLEN